MLSRAHTRGVLFGCALGLLTLAAVGYAAATIPAAEGTIHACGKAPNGKVRVVANPTPAREASGRSRGTSAARRGIPGLLVPSAHRVRRGRRERPANLDSQVLRVRRGRKVLRGRKASPALRSPPSRS